jgi:hypothetical protein
MGVMRLFVGMAAALAVGLGSTGAFAQQGAVHGEAHPKRGPMIFRFEKSRNESAAVARAAAAKGDCKGALDLFDEALRHSIDPTLYRDRGVCHDKLGDLYPAIDDYRTYLSEEPDAPDADKFRARLAELQKNADRDIAMTEAGSGGSFAVEMAGGMHNGETPSGASSTPAKKEPEPATTVAKADAGKPLRTLERDESRDAEAKKSPVRLGHGFIVGAFYEPRYVLNEYDFRFGQGIGLKLGYSLGASSTLVLELGYINQLSSGTATTKDGFTGTFGYEARIPFDRFADNQLLFGAQGGYEHVTDNSLGQVYSSFIAEGRAGYRHVFGPSFALDFLAQGGLMGTFPIDAPAGTNSFNAGGFVGGEVLVSVGF